MSDGADFKREMRRAFVRGQISEAEYALRNIAHDIDCGAPHLCGSMIPSGPGPHICKVALQNRRIATLHGYLAKVPRD